MLLTAANPKVRASARAPDDRRAALRPLGYLPIRIIARLLRSRSRQRTRRSAPPRGRRTIGGPPCGHWVVSRFGLSLVFFALAHGSGPKVRASARAPDDRRAVFRPLGGRRCGRRQASSIGSPPRSSMISRISSVAASRGASSADRSTMLTPSRSLRKNG